MKPAQVRRGQVRPPLRRQTRTTPRQRTPCFRSLRWRVESGALTLRAPGSGLRHRGVSRVSPRRIQFAAGSGCRGRAIPRLRLTRVIDVACRATPFLPAVRLGRPDPTGKSGDGRRIQQADESAHVAYQTDRHTRSSQAHFPSTYDAIGRGPSRPGFTSGTCRLADRSPAGPSPGRAPMRSW